MIFRGHIEKGMVVFDEPVSLTDGTHVRVEALGEMRGGGAPSGDDFWRESSIEELRAQQGVEPIQRLDDLVGQGATLWNDDHDFEQFLQSIYDRRREGIRP